MKYIQRLLIVFLLTSIVWGLIFGIWQGLYIGFENGILYGLKRGFIFGFIVITAIVLYDYLFRKQVFRKYGKRSFDVNQTREIFLTGDNKDIVQRSVFALETMRGIKTVSPDFDKNLIKATTGITWKTFGEVIKLKFNQKGNQISVQIQSSPRVKTTIFDCGKNIENVEKICNLLKTI